MPAGDGTLGRNLILSFDGDTTIPVREKAVAVNGEPVDVTDDQSSGYRELLAEPGVQSLDLTLSGVLKSDVFRAIAFASSNRVKTATLTYPDGGVISGDFYVGPYSETGPYQDAMTFEVTLNSSGAFAYTAA